MISRITKRAGFARFRGVSTLRHRALTQRAVPDPVVGAVHLAIATPKRSGSAVARNRVRRQVRAAMRARADRVPSGWYLVSLQGAAVDTDWGQLGISLDALVDQVRAQTADVVQSAPTLAMRAWR
ncbi:MAG: ribonuclease P protein component [Ilumatobacteraceae bacterium]